MNRCKNLSQTDKDNTLTPDDAALIDYSIAQGATRAVILPAEDITTEEKLAGYCVEPGCENYGLSKSCPPHVEGPDAFKRWLSDYTRALFFKIEVPSELLFSHDRRELFELLHRASAAVEIKAKAMGLSRSRAFAGGSCKATFCYEKLSCRVVDNNENCRFPDASRPSMSGYGINVGELVSAAGWDDEPLIAGEQANETAGLYGLVLLG